MKTLRIALFFILGTVVTLHSFAQKVKKENKAKIKMEIVDNEGNKKVIDTTFTFADWQDYSAIMRQIKEKAGFSDEKLSKLKEELKVLKKHFALDMDIMMNNFDKDSLHKQLMISREDLQSGKENLKKALEELKVELESMKMNEVAMQKLKKAMKELNQVNWTEHTEHLKNQMYDLHKYFDKDVWIDKDGEKIIIKKKHHSGNTIFFGDEKDLEHIDELDGEQRIIVKKLKDEAAKGEAIFISDDAHVVKEFKDEDGNVKVFSYKIKSGDGEAKEKKMILNGNAKNFKGIHDKMVMFSPAGEKEIALANEKGIFDAKTESLMLKNFSLNIDNEITTIGANFEEKGKLLLQVYDKEMNKLWEKNAGKVHGDWSTEIPADVLKETGVYYFLFEQDKKVKLMKLISN